MCFITKNMIREANEKLKRKVYFDLIVHPAKKPSTMQSVA